MFRTNSSKEAKSGDNSANLSRSFKFKENTDNNNIQGHMYNYKGQVTFYLLFITLALNYDLNLHL